MSNFSCSNGVYDCQYAGIPAEAVSSCADYNEKFDDMEGREWIVIVSVTIMCLMAFGIGSNDAANSWATSVGSGAIPLKTAVIVGGIFEFFGTVLLGSAVANTIKEDISDINDQDCWACGYCNSKMSLFQIGMLSSLLSTAVFLMLSSVTSMPVSATHAVVGSVAGMSIGAVGTDCVDWSMTGMGALMASWVISPILAGIVALFVYFVTKNRIMNAKHPRDYALPNVPIFITLITMVMTFLICIKSHDLKDLGIVNHAIITFSLGIGAFLIATFAVLPWIKRNLPTVVEKREMDKSNASNDEKESDVVNEEDISPETPDDDLHADDHDESIQLRQFKRSCSRKSNSEDSSSQCLANETDDALFCFRVLLIFNAALKSFAHGANDTANATGPVGAVLEVYDYGLDICAKNDRVVPRWVLVLAGAFVALGVYSLGHKVIKTIGEKLTIIDYHSGFCIEFGTCVTVVFATIVGIPVSTTHCQIGAVIGTGIMTAGKQNTSWKLINKIIMTWILTVPFSGMLSVGFMELFRPTAV